MQGNKTVIDTLNGLLALELTAMDQYFIHSEMYADWGINKLHERIAHEFEDEKGHAKALIERMLFLEGTPDMVKRIPLRVGKDVPAMLENDLQVEYEVQKALVDAIQTCEQAQDYVSRDILEKLLNDTEVDHAWWLEKQLGLIKKIGLENYIQSQL